ncbi:MAG: FAD-dependent oxidoreductase [Pseudomonadota bacterium]
MERIIVVGGGQAGASLVAKLRASGHQGPVTLICEESVPPYQRPPLSKAYLKGEMELERLFLRPESFYEENGIDLRLNTTAKAIDREHKVLIADGASLPYDQLALVTGSVPRRLPGAIGGDLSGVHVVRTLKDIDEMAPAFVPGKRAVIVGGGYIGLEAAAVAAEKGLDVTLIEATDRILGRVACPETADFIRAMHQGHGVDIREGVGVEKLLGDEHVTAARLADGTDLAADIVIVGIGITPSTSLAEDAGLTLDNGIAVDAMGRTSDPAIWAAGDCASFPWRGGRLRLESVQNAIDQSEAVAQNMLGAEAPYVPHPWFWSDQYDLKLQIAGLGGDATHVVVRPGERAGTQSHWYYRDADLVAVDALNDPRAYMVGKRLLEAGQSPAPEQVSDPGVVLKSLLKV